MLVLGSGAAVADDDLPVKLAKCGHIFHKGCILQAFEKCQKKCPTCGAIYGIITGTQPTGQVRISTSDVFDSVVSWCRWVQMHFKRDAVSLPGYEDCGTITIRYDIPSGIQGEEHPNPGVPYGGARRYVYCCVH